MLLIERFGSTPHGTFGTLKFNDFQCYTVEKPWEFNKQSISCIPEGTYTANRYLSPTDGRGVVWMLNNVPDRSFIQIHRGNTMHDVIGCVAVGTDLGFIDNLWAVANSRVAFDRLMGETKDLDEITVKITSFCADKDLYYSGVEE